MPEFPEVYTIYREINSIGITRVAGVESASGGYKEIESEITKIEILGKKILFELKNKMYLVISFGMTGKLLLNNEIEDIKYLRNTILCGEGVNLYFYDVRNFGNIKYLNESEMILLRGRYPLSPVGDDYIDLITENIKFNTREIFITLLDQSKATGVGSYIAQEALLKAGLRPNKKNISLEEAKKLSEAVSSIIKASIDLGGATMRDYRTLYGKGGGYADMFKIYGRDICGVCSSPTKYIKIQGRGCRYCATCQI